MIGRPVNSYTAGSSLCWVVVATVSVSMAAVAIATPPLECEGSGCVMVEVVNWR